MRSYLDMDPGIDDAAAMAVALTQMDVAGVTTVAGNVAGVHTFRNAGTLLRAFGRSEVALVPGADEPLFAAPQIADQVHGANGLGHYGPEAEGLVRSSSLPAWQWMASKLESELEPVDWIATGPLTNVARFLAAFDDPRFRDRVRAITVMGGSLAAGGNVTPSAEFNFYADPDAADFVLGSGWPVRMVGLDVTLLPSLGFGDLERLQRFGQAGLMLADMLSFYGKAIVGLGESIDRIHLHDVVAVAAAAHPDKFRWISVPLRIAREGDLRGTVVALSDRSPRPRVQVAVDIDQDWFLSWFWQSLEGYAPLP